MPGIDPQFLDVDFTKDPHFVPGYNGPGETGLFASYEASLPMIPESQWRAEVEKIDAAGGGADLLVTRIYDQGNEGSCVANAWSQAHETLQALQYGRENVVPLSAISLYKRIGSSPQSGAMVSDGLKEIQNRGVLPLDTPENRQKFGGAVMPNTGFRQPYPANWQETARKFRGVEAHTIQTVEGMFTALLNNTPVVVGRSGHSICYLRLIWRNGWVVKYANSWGNWGDAGFGYDSMNLIRSSARYAFALRTVTREV